MIRLLTTILGFILSLTLAQAGPPSSYTPQTTPYSGTELWYCSRGSTDGSCNIANLLTAGLPGAFSTVNAIGNVSITGGSLAVVDLHTVIPVNGVWISDAGAAFSNCPLIGCLAGDHQRSSVYVKSTAAQDATISEYMVTLDNNLNSGKSPPWQTSTAYVAGNQVVDAVAGNIYQETTSSCTSASLGSGPSGTGIGIVDNTCHWDYKVSAFAAAKVGFFNSSVTGANAGYASWGMANDMVIGVGDTGVFKVGAEFDTSNNALDTSVIGYNVHNIFVSGNIGLYPLTADIAVNHPANGTNYAARYGLLFTGGYEASQATISDQTTNGVLGLELAGTYSVAALVIRNATTANNILLQAGANKANSIYGEDNGVIDWAISIPDGTAKTGGNAGENFNIGRWNDAGSFIDLPFVINRATGNVTIAHSLVVSDLSLNGGIIKCGNETTDYINLYAYGAGAGITCQADGTGSPTTVGATFATRTKNWPGGSAAQIGAIHWGFADMPTASGSPPVWAQYSETRKYPGTTGFALTDEHDITNFVPGLAMLSSYDAGLNGGQLAINLWLASGGACGSSVLPFCYNPLTSLTNLTAKSAQYAIGIVSSPSDYLGGIYFSYNSLHGVDGHTLGPFAPAIRMATGHSFEWESCTNVTSYPLNCALNHVTARIGTQQSTAAILQQLVFYDTTALFQTATNAELVILFNNADTSGLQVSGASSTNTPTVSAIGTPSDLNVALQPKGAGSVIVGGGKIIVSAMPISCTSQPTGTLWNSSGTIHIC